MLLEGRCFPDGYVLKFLWKYKTGIHANIRLRRSLSFSPVEWLPWVKFSHPKTPLKLPKSFICESLSPRVQALWFYVWAYLVCPLSWLLLVEFGGWWVWCCSACRSTWQPDHEGKRMIHTPPSEGIGRSTWGWNPSNLRLWNDSSFKSIRELWHKTLIS